MFVMLKKMMHGLNAQGNGTRYLAFTELKNLLLKANLPTHLNMQRERMQFGMMKTKIGVLDLLPCVAKKSGIPAFMLVAKFTLVVTIFVLQIQIMSGSTWIEMVIGSQQIPAYRLFLPQTRLWKKRQLLEQLELQLLQLEQLQWPSI